MNHASFSAKFPPPKPKNTDRRTREYLTPAEVTQLMQAARHIGRHGQRDTTLILLMYRHGLRVSEVKSLRWESIDLKMALLHVRRLKHGVAAVHPLHGPELRTLRKLQLAHPGLPYVFLSERGSPLSDRTIRHILLRAGIDAQFPFPVHPHMLRHACGFYLANQGIDTRSIQQYLGHRNRDYSIFAGFYYGLRGACIVEFGSQHSNKEGKAMRGPGAYRPDPPEGMTAMADLPPPEVVPSSRNATRQPCPRCGYSASRDTQSQRTLHD